MSDAHVSRSEHRFDEQLNRLWFASICSYEDGCQSFVMWDRYCAQLRIICIDEFSYAKNRNHCINRNYLTKNFDVDVDATINEA
jgi:hypothetical protein